MLGKMNVAALLGVTIALVATMSPVGAQCSNGLAGVEDTSLDVCCVAECGTCGGPGCGSAGGNGSTLTSAECCSNEILTGGILCIDTNEAPCVITTQAADANSTCDNGQTGVQDPDTDVCCPLECGDQCGGDNCGMIPGVDSSQCCATAIIASGAICSDNVDPPCVVDSSVASDSNSTCSNGITGVEDTLAGICCLAACGQCGGAGCGDIPGLSNTDCCSANIEATGTLCSVTGSAPCIVDPPEVTPSTCPNGIAGVQDGTVCCAETCNGVCGGDGCGKIAGTNGPSDCCSATILASGVQCEQGVEAPCIMINGTYTNAPAMAPTVGGTVSPTAGSRGFSMAPTEMAASTAPTPGSREIDFGEPSAAPTTVMGPTASPTEASRGITDDPTASPVAASGGSTPSAGTVVTLMAVLGGAFAIRAAARN